MHFDENYPVCGVWPVYAELAWTCAAGLFLVHGTSYSNVTAPREICQKSVFQKQVTIWEECRSLL